MSRPDPSFIESLRRHPAVRAELRDAAEKARKRSQAISNNIMPRKGRKVQVSKVAGGASMLRHRGEIQVVENAAGVFLVNTSHGGHIDEWGSANNPPYAPLRRGVLAAGFRFRPDPKA